MFDQGQQLFLKRIWKWKRLGLEGSSKLGD
jgi:hypothetical protein